MNDLLTADELRTDLLMCAGDVRRMLALSRWKLILSRLWRKRHALRDALREVEGVSS